MNRALLSWLGTASLSPGQVLDHSTSLWALALGEGEGLIAARRAQAVICLPGQLAFAFRGVLSFWTAREVSDEAPARNAREIASTLLLGFIE